MVLVGQQSEKETKKSLSLFNSSKYQMDSFRDKLAGGTLPFSSMLNTDQQLTSNLTQLEFEGNISLSLFNQLYTYSPCVEFDENFALLLFNSDE